MLNSILLILLSTSGFAVSPDCLNKAEKTARSHYFDNGYCELAAYECLRSCSISEVKKYEARQDASVGYYQEAEVVCGRPSDFSNSHVYLVKMGVLDSKCPVSLTLIDKIGN